MVEQTECYICTDPTEERSPCQCKAPVHLKCLLQWVKKNDNMGVNCSICHTPLEGIEPPRRPVETSIHVPSVRPFTIKCWSLTRFLFVIMCGYIGKFIFAMFFNPSWLAVDDYWSPFDLIFVVCAFVVSSFFTTVALIVLKILTYISRTDSNQYEEFNDSDSDSDGAELSIV